MKTGTRHSEDEEKNADRLSNLPDCVILHILSFLDTTKDALQTCVLSKRWTNIWKRLPNLILASSQFKTTNKFLSNFLYHRDSSISLHHIVIHLKVNTDPHLIETIVKNAVTHNVQLIEFNFKCDIQSFPSCLFSSHTLTSLHLTVNYPILYHRKILFPNSLHLPALTSLALGSFSFPVGNDGRAEPFSALKRLKSLIIYECEVMGAQNLHISSTTLVRLIVSTCHPYYAPLNTNFGIELSTSSLCEFYFRGIPLRKLCESKSNLSNITQVSIELTTSLWNSRETSLVLLEWLVELANTQSLSVNSDTLEVLSLIPDLLKTELPSLCNLKSLKVRKAPRSFVQEVLRQSYYRPSHQEDATALVHRCEVSSIPDGIVDILRRKSRSAEVEIIDD